MRSSYPQIPKLSEVSWFSRMIGKIFNGTVLFALVSAVLALFFMQMGQETSPPESIGSEQPSLAIGPSGPQGSTGPSGPQGSSGETATTTNPSVTMSSEDGAFSYTGSPISATVLAIDSLRVVEIAGDFSTVSNFGTGQLSFELPFTCALENDGSSGHIHDASKVNRYLIVGECEAGTSKMELFYIGSKSQIEPLTGTSLVTLDTGDSFTLHATLLAQ